MGLFGFFCFLLFFLFLFLFFLSHFIPSLFTCCMHLSVLVLLLSITLLLHSPGLPVGLASRGLRSFYYLLGRGDIADNANSCTFIIYNMSTIERLRSPVLVFCGLYPLWLPPSSTLVFYPRGDVDDNLQTSDGLDSLAHIHIKNTLISIPLLRLFAIKG